MNICIFSKRFLIISLFSLLSIKVNANNALYSKEDLNALFISKDYKEYLDHGLDISPSKRDATWTENTLTMALGRIKEIEQKLTYSTSDFVEIQKYSNWNSIKDKPFFILAKFKFYGSYMTRCPKQHKSSHCLEVIEKLLNEKNIKDQFAKKIIWTVNTYYPDSPVTNRLGPIYAILGNSEFSDLYCSKPWFKINFIQSIQNLNKDELSKYKTTNVNNKCFEQLSSSINHDLMSAEVSEKNKKLYLVLYPYLDEIFKLAYQVKYLLTKPVPEKLLNYSWNSINQLSNDHVKREKTLNLLEQYKIQTYVFAHHNKKFIHTIFNHLSKNVPEIHQLLDKSCKHNHYCDSYKNFINNIQSEDKLNTILSAGKR